MVNRRTSAAAVLALLAAVTPVAAEEKADVPAPQPYVVVATLDTGTNPFHPAWRREEARHPAEYLPGYPADAPVLNLELADTFEDSVLASRDELGKLHGGGLHWIPGTNIIGTWARTDDALPIFDPSAPSGATHSHGAAASSQIAGTDFGMAPEAYVVIMDRTPDTPTGGSPSNDTVYATNAEGLRWAADQPWIDIIHTNIQNIVPLAGNPVPYSSGYHEAVADAVGKGKMVVSAGGNWYALTTETSPHAGPPGVLAAGANDNCGYTEFSNPNPHVVMDGAGTVAAEPNGFGTTTFSGTSSASPRITGYVAQLLLELRREVGDVHGFRDGALIVLEAEATRPQAGPLADGRLTAAELHEVVRKTAAPNPHASQWDGPDRVCIPPKPPDLPASFYPKMGYGEVSEHTFDAAVDVALGRSAMPQRPVEDAFYETSQTARRAFWD